MSRHIYIVQDEGLIEDDRWESYTFSSFEEAVDSLSRLEVINKIYSIWRCEIGSFKPAEELHEEAFVAKIPVHAPKERLILQSHNRPDCSGGAHFKAMVKDGVRIILLRFKAWHIKEATAFVDNWIYARTKNGRILDPVGDWISAADAAVFPSD